MKKTIALFLTLLLLLSLPACGIRSAGASEEPALRIVTTIFPEYDWVMEILGDNPAGAEVTLLMDSGVDLHSYQPTAEDILTITTCDLLIYVGGESDRWVQDALTGAREDLVVINLLDTLGKAAKTETMVEGMEGEAEEDEYDEHVWLSLRNASVLCEAIAGAISSLDEANGEIYARNTADYQARLSALDQAYTQAVFDGTYDTLLFGDRFPFRYLTDDYGLQYYAAFAGCSAETEASFETIIFLAEKVDALGLPAILQLENTDGAIADTIRKTTASGDQKILTLDSLQSVTAADVEKGVTYLSIMERNLDVLREALG